MCPFSLPIAAALALACLPAAPPPTPSLQEAAGPAPAMAADSQVAADEEGRRWQFAVRPFVWAASVDGTVTAAGQVSVDFELEFSDIFEDLDFAWMMQLEARSPDDRLGILFESLFFDFSGEKGPVEWDLEQRLVELDLTWRVAKGVELVGGARYIDVDAAAAVPSLGLAVGGGDDWVDPIVGVRGQLGLGERWSLYGRGDIGGFGVGSEFSWQLAGYVAFHVSRHFDIGLGYRHLDIERDKDSLDLDLALSGPLMGLGFNF